jgi:predicted nucleic acid-binding protein
VKLIREEPESEALRTYLADDELICCELALAEVPRAIRRATAADSSLDQALLLQRGQDLLDALALFPLDAGLLELAGSLAEPALRTLDAIHVASALELLPLDGFVSYDERQAAAARLAGLRTVAPGV